MHTFAEIKGFYIQAMNRYFSVDVVHPNIKQLKNLFKGEPSDLNQELFKNRRFESCIQARTYSWPFVFM